MKRIIMCLMMLSGSAHAAEPIASFKPKGKPTLESIDQKLNGILEMVIRNRIETVKRRDQVDANEKCHTQCFKDWIDDDGGDENDTMELSRACHNKCDADHPMPKGAAVEC